MEGIGLVETRAELLNAAPPDVLVSGRVRAPPPSDEPRSGVPGPNCAGVVAATVGDAQAELRRSVTRIELQPLARRPRLPRTDGPQSSGERARPRRCAMLRRCRREFLLATCQGPAGRAHRTHDVDRMTQADQEPPPRASSRTQPAGTAIPATGGRGSSTTSLPFPGARDRQPPGWWRRGPASRTRREWGESEGRCLTPLQAPFFTTRNCDARTSHSTLLVEWPACAALDRRGRTPHGSLRVPGARRGVVCRRRRT